MNRESQAVPECLVAGRAILGAHPTEEALERHEDKFRGPRRGKGTGFNGLPGGFEPVSHIIQFNC
jgi:hypothetical protein